MLTFGDLQKNPAQVDGLGDVLVAALDRTEVVVRVGDGPKNPEATMIFKHETIGMMRADRTDQKELLLAQLSAESWVVPLKKKPDSVWDHITVGRASTADIVIDDPAVSNVHAHFAADPDGHSLNVQDVGSSNGTFVNRTPLHPHEPRSLSAGDCVRFGQSIFYFLPFETLRELLEC